MITLEQAKILRYHDIFPPNIIGWYVQYDNIYQEENEAEFWDLETKKHEDETTDYGYSNPDFFPVISKEDFHAMPIDKTVSTKGVRGIPDYLMGKYLTTPNGA